MRDYTGKKLHIGDKVVFVKDVTVSASLQKGIVTNIR